MIEIKRTWHNNADFMRLTNDLDAELKHLYSNYQQKFDAQNKMTENVQVILGYAGHEAVACGALRPMDDAGMVELKRMFVKPTFRGLGISKQILMALENWAREQSHRHIKLETGKNQPEAIALYLGAGYQKIAPYGEYLFIDEAICMEKKL